MTIMHATAINSGQCIICQHVSSSLMSPGGVYRIHNTQDDIAPRTKF